MSIRKLGIVVAVVCGASLIAPVAAGAQTTPTPVAVTSFSHIPVTGTANGNKTFTGHFNVNHFVTRDGKTYALGTLTGTIGNRFVKRSNVAIPVGVQRSSTTGTASPAKTCRILHLVLGPLHLNLLGLHVDLNKVVLNITAVSGPGNLLGNLLCSVANLLNGPPALGPAQLTALLNVLQQLLNVPSLLTL